MPQSSTESAEESALIDRMSRMIGYVPVGTRDLLRVLSHPDVIRLTRDFLDKEEGKFDSLLKDPVPDPCKGYVPPSAADIWQTPQCEYYCARCGRHEDDHPEVLERKVRRTQADLAWVTRPIEDDEWED